MYQNHMLHYPWLENGNLYFLPIDIMLLTRHRKWIRKLTKKKKKCDGKQFLESLSGDLSAWRRPRKFFYVF